MKFGKLSKILICAAIAGTVGVAATGAGCSAETDHPTVEITYNFNQEVYTLEFKLYRNMYPNTVRHFIELADSGFYNDTVIHDYETQDWIGGGYKYDSAAYTSGVRGEDLAQYFIDNSKEEEYYEKAKTVLTPTVYGNKQYENGVWSVEKDTALATLIGEFSGNIGQEIEKGALSADYGCLKMFYYEKKTSQHVYVQPATAKSAIDAQYKNNCATSLFALQVGTTSTYTASKYCVFATVTDTSALAEFNEAVTAHMNAAYGNSDSAKYLSTKVKVDVNEAYSTNGEDSDREETFRAPKTAIVIQQVKVTKY